MTRFTADGRSISIGERLGRGGEGDVHAVTGDTGNVVKIYTLTDLGERDRKIPAMVRLQMGQAHSQVAFPRAVVRDEQNRFRGFTMARAHVGRPVHDLYSPASRKQRFPDADFRFLVHVAINVTRAVGTVHAAGCIIGDINHSGFLVGKDGLVTVIDADSFQFQDGIDRYLCRVGVPEFTAPELQGRSLNGIVRNHEHDAFGLAVLLFQLLYLGRHPFAGVPKGGDLPLPEAIRDHQFAYSKGRQTRLAPPPNMPDLDIHGTGLASLFETAFAPPSAVGRPKVDLWLRGLTALRDSLKHCATVPEHYHAGDTQDCPWCKIERNAGVVLFLTPFRPGQFDQAGTMPAFDLDAMRARLIGLSLPSRFLYAGMPRASSRLPPLIGIMGWINRLLNPMTQELADLAELDRQLRVAFGRITETVFIDRLWKTAIEVAELARERSRLSLTYAHSEENARQAFQKTAMMTFLESQLIRRATITGIGLSLQTMLAAFGYETAADIRRANSTQLQRVQGIGPVKAQALLTWTKAAGRKFQMPQIMDAAARADLEKTRARLIEQARQTDRDMAERLARIGTEQRRIAALSITPNKDITQIVARRQQIASLIAAKRREVPDMPRPTEVRVDERLRQNFNDALRTPPPAPTKSFSTKIRPNTVATPSGKLSCPQCGGPMIRRTAHKGRRSGQQFYGCSRFPKCKGTRNIP